MILGRVTGNVISTIHHPIVDGRKLLLAERLDEHGKPTGGYLIALDGTTLVFVEVRYRRHPLGGNTAATVTPAKQRRLNFHDF